MSETTEVKVVKINLRNSEVVSWEELPGPLEHKHYNFSEGKKSSLNARYWYGIIFLLINLSAWFVRDYGQKVFPQPLYLKTCGHEGDDCFRTMGVLRVSLGCFIFFILMFLTTCKTSKLYEVRNSWHSQWWSLKFIPLIVSLVAPFFLHPDIIQFYGELARVGAGIFLVLQLISVIQFITWLNKYCVPDEKEKRSCFFGLFISTIFYLASICGIGVMYPLYASKASCSLNIFFITWTGILLLVMMAISLHSKVNRGLLSSGIMAAYAVFLCWTALRSEPANPKCHSQKKASGNNDWTTILGFLIAIFAIVMATFSTGIDSQSFQFRKDNVQMEDDIPYKYGFFHLIFSLGAMYFAMLFISWNLDHTTRKWSIDVGWASTWVKIVNEWLAATIYSK
ncbi:Serine incorporator/TMS membrane protein [Dillenia turbinata]|uniref:Serine incorporator/TMS membrane protein n=1 Tax=Dillenia turbinata TaxID=194707 RepID=A0AAN8Z9G9_9MAGN